MPSFSNAAMSLLVALLCDGGVCRVRGSTQESSAASLRLAPDASRSHK